MSLTHYRHLALRHLGHRSADRNLQRRNVERGHVILAATFVVVVNDVLAHIIIRARVFDVCLPSSIVDDKDEHQDCASSTKMDNQGEKKTHKRQISYLCLLATCTGGKFQALWECLKQFSIGQMPLLAMVYVK